MKHGWDSILDILEHMLNPGLFKVWIKPLRAKLEGNSLTLTAPNEFVASRVRDRLLEDITEATKAVLETEPQIVVCAAPKVQPAVGEAPATASSAQPQMAGSVAAAFAAAPPMDKPLVESASSRIVSSTSQPVSLQRSFAPQAVGDSPLVLDRNTARNWRFKFDDFVVGPSNALAHAASQSICNNSIPSDQVFICSGPGLGKTHLLQAIGHQLYGSANTSSLRVKYMTAEEFATNMVVALKTRGIDRFKDDMRQNVDLLLLEDIHFLQGKEKIQDELLATLKALQSRGSKVVFTSSFLPRELSNVDPQLASRFGSGFLTVIDRPDFETRMRIVEQKASRTFHSSVPGDVSAFLAENIQTDIRQLESCLQSLIFKAKLLKQNIDLDLAQEILSHYDLSPSTPGIDKIVKAVCETFQLKATDLQSKSRKQSIVMARNTAFFLARKYTDLSLKDIGERFNRRHSTVLKGITKMEREMSKQTPTGRQLERALKILSI